MSAIQLSHPGPPIAPVLCIKKINARNAHVAKRYEPLDAIHNGTSAIANHSNRCAYNPVKKIFFRAPVRSVSTLAGIEMNDAMNGSAASNPI